MKVLNEKGKIKVSSSQYNHIFNNSIHFPYSVASLIAYVKQYSELNHSFNFEKVFVFRDQIYENIKKCKDTNILLCSCYVWNWEITKHLAQEVKKINPKCLIIFGGPHVPNQSESFFVEHPYVDIIVHGEGEDVLKNILESYIHDKNFSKILGIETKDFKNLPQPRISNFDSLPSPYLNNLVWELVDKQENIQWIASWETNRGCPYQCTFCDWGSLTNSKMRKWTEEKLLEEIEWFGQNKISYIDCCDANFGIFVERDMNIAKKLRETKEKMGYPKTFRPNWAKFSSEKIIPIAKQLQDVGLLRAVTLSVQSLDKTTLDIIKRENIKFDTFSELTESFKINNIPTYSEIIIGLPGETVESFKNGLEIMANDTKIGTIQIYHCSVLPNAPMNYPEYLSKHKIKKIKSPLESVHSKIEQKSITEYEEIIIGTNSFSLDELKEMYIFGWMIQTFHSLGILEIISQFYKQNYKINLINFYETLQEFTIGSKSIFSNESLKVNEFMNDGYSGKGWNHYDRELGGIYWPIEEASWLRLTSNHNELSHSIHDFLLFLERKNDIHTPDDCLQDLIKFQLFLLTTKQFTNKIKSETFNYNWQEFFTNNKKLCKKNIQHSYENLVIQSDPIQWNFETIWFGRFKQKYKISPQKLNSNILHLI